MGNGAALCVSARAHPRLYHFTAFIRGEAVMEFLRRCSASSEVFPVPHFALLSSYLIDMPH